MTEFIKNFLDNLLEELHSNQQSIQSLHKAVVLKAAYEELHKEKDPDDSKEKDPNVSKEKDPEPSSSSDRMTLNEALSKIISYAEAKRASIAETKHSLHKLFVSFEERGIFDAAKIQEFKEALDQIDDTPPPKTATKRKTVNIEPKEPEKNPKVEVEHERHPIEMKIKFAGQIQILSPETLPHDITPEVNLKIERNIRSSLETPPIDPPEPKVNLQIERNIRHSLETPPVDPLQHEVNLQIERNIRRSLETPPIDPIQHEANLQIMRNIRRCLGIPSIDPPEPEVNLPIGTPQPEDLVRGLQQIRSLGSNIDPDDLNEDAAYSTIKEILLFMQLRDKMPPSYSLDFIYKMVHEVLKGKMICNSLKAKIDQTKEELAQLDKQRSEMFCPCKPKK